MNKLIAALTLAVGIASCTLQPAYANDRAMSDRLAQAFLACIQNGSVIVNTASGASYLIRCETIKLVTREEM